MANQTITQLPDAGPITGTELVPIVQNGGTVKTTTAAISASPSQTQTFLTKNQEPTLPNSRFLSTGTGLGLTDGGAGSFYRITLNRAAGSLESAATGVVVKNNSSTVIARTLTTSGNGIGVTNGSGVSGNPTFQLTGIAESLANMSGTGMLAIVGGTAIAGRQIVGTANQIDVANGNGAGNPSISIADNAILPGVEAITVPSGTTAEQPAGSAGQLRFNTSTNTFDGYDGSSWGSFSLSTNVTSFSAGATGLTPSSPTSGNVVLSGILNVANGGTGSSSVPVAGSVIYGNGTNYQSTLAGTQGQVLTSTATGAPVWSGINGGTF